MHDAVKFSWYKRPDDGKRVYEVWDAMHRRLIYQGCGYVAARRIYNRAINEARLLEQYNQMQAVRHA